MRRLSRKGQSTLEYVIIWTAIIGTLLLAATKFIKPAIDGAVNKASDKITNEVNKLTETDK